MTTDGRTAYLNQLASAAYEIAYARKTFDERRADLARRAKQTADMPTFAAIGDLAFVRGSLDATAEAKARLETVIEKLKALHYVGKESLALTAEEFAATTGLDAETYEAVKS